MSDFITTPVQASIISGLTGSYCLKHDNILSVAGVGLQWHIVVEAREQNIVVNITKASATARIATSELIFPVL